MFDLLRFVNRITLMIALVGVFCGAAFGQGESDGSASEIVARSFKISKTLDWEEKAKLVHPDGLEKLKGYLWPTLDRIIAADTAASQNAFVLALGLEVVDGKLVDQSSEQLYVNLMKMLVAQSPDLAEATLDSKHDIIGEVVEGNLIHVVTRVSSISTPQAVSRMNVVTVQADGDSWKLALSTELEGMAIGIANLLNQ